MKYIVRTQGVVYESRQVAYAINAESCEEAEQLAKERFASEYTVAGAEPSAAASGVRPGIFVGLVTLAVSAVLAFIGFRTGTERNPVIIRPDLTSLLYAAGIYFVLLAKARGVKKLFSAKEWKEVFRSPESIVLAVLLIVLIASLIQLMFSSMQVGFSFLSVRIDFRAVALILALIAYFGSGPLSLICLALFLVLSKFSVGGLGKILGNVKGYIFIGCALIGVIAYLSTVPVVYQAVLNIKALIHNPVREMREESHSAQNQ